MTPDPDHDVDDRFDDPPMDGAEGLFSIPRLVLGVHVLTAAGAAGLAILAFTNGSTLGALSFFAIAAMIAVAGVAAARIARRRDL